MEREEDLRRRTYKTSRFWNVSRETGEFLRTLVLVSGAKHVLEIGTSNGYSGMYLADAARRNGGKLWTVESHQERAALAKRNFRRAALSPYVTQVYGHAPEILSEIPGRFDCVFLDATKMEHQSYFDAVFPRLEYGGLIVADNVFSHKKELASYILHVKTHACMESVVFDSGTGLLCSLKKNKEIASTFFLG